jgi:6-phosphogluconolactonase
MEKNIEVKITGSPKKVAKRATKYILALMQNSGNQRFDIALSGGSTPKLLFERLAEKLIDKREWKRIHLWWGDERCVSMDSSESNFKMTEETLLSKVPLPKENIHQIRGEENPEAEALRYGEEIRNNLNLLHNWPVFDLIILGLGEDGHTASIFPDQMELLKSNEICDVAIHPATGQKRITLTGNVINNANEILFLVTGESKAEKVAEIMNNEISAEKLPAYHIIPTHGKLTWFIDEDAAANT